MARKSDFVTAARSAKTGRWVKMSYAKRYPHRTVVQRMRKARRRA
jgi:hypothetical protein